MNIPDNFKNILKPYLPCLQKKKISRLKVDAIPKNISSKKRYKVKIFFSDNICKYYEGEFASSFDALDDGLEKFGTAKIIVKPI